jgi:hypothetical protein
MIVKAGWKVWTFVKKIGTGIGVEVGKVAGNFVAGEKKDLEAIKAEIKKPACCNHEVKTEVK